MSGRKNRGKVQAPNAAPEAVLETLDYGVVAVSGEVVTYANTAASDLLGEAVEAGETAPAALRSVLDALKHSDDSASVTRQVGEGKSPRYVRMTAQPMQADTEGGESENDPVRRPQRVVHVRDVTAEEATAAALRSQNGLLEAIMQTSVAAIAVVNEQGQVTYANERAREVLSLERTPDGDWTFRHLDWTITRIDDEGAGEESAAPGDLPLQRVLETGEPIRDMRCRIRWPDGTEKVVSIHAAPLAAGDRGTTQVVFSVDDITQRIEAERRLQREKRFSEAAINSLPGIFYMVDREGRNRRWNRHLEDLTGYGSDELEGRQLSDLFESREGRSVESDVSEVFRTGQFQIEADVVSDDGTRTPHVFTGKAVEIEDTPYLVGVGLDVTQQLEREQELRQAKEVAEEARAEAEEARAEAEKMNRLKSAFLANMSHEIRTPLTGIIGSADVLEEELPEDKQLLVGHIAKSAYRLKDTLDAVLEISKLEAEARSLHLEPVDVTTVVGEAVDGLRETAGDAGVQLRLSVEPSAWRVRLDASALKSVLTNLVHNAIKFTPEGGTVTVDLPAPEGDELTVRVVDTGVGISDDFLEEIFEPFTQESSGADRDHEGSGLGLAITRHLVELMNGSIDVDSEKGEGTTFTVRLPAEAL